MANFIPPANGASLGIFVLKIQTNSLTPFMEVCRFFFQLNLLPPYSLRSHGDNLCQNMIEHIIFLDLLCCDLA